MRRAPPVTESVDSEWMPSSTAEMLTLPPSRVTVPVASMPSLPLVRRSVPSVIRILPREASSPFSA